MTSSWSWFFKQARSHTQRRDACRLLCGALWSSALAVSVASAQVSFSDVSADAHVGRAGESYGASWGDLNGDGYLDIFASNHRTQPSGFLNMGDGTFYETAKQVRTWVNRPNADTHGGSWADFDNDGDQDLLISTGTGNFSQFLVNEGGRLVDRTTQYALNISNLGGRLPMWLDYDRDRRPDFVMTQYGGVAKLFHQNADGAAFTESSTSVKLLCKRFQYGHLLDVTSDGRVDFLCADETLFPQKIYNTLPFPWQKVFDNAAPTTIFPTVAQVPDSIVADFNNDGRMDMFLLSGTQLHPSAVVQSGPNNFEAQLAGGNKGFNFVTTGAVTFTPDWNKADEATTTDLAKIQIGAGARHPTTTTFTLDPSDPSVVGMPPAPTTQSQLPVMQIGFTPSTQRWTLVIKTKLDTSTVSVFSEAYIQVGTADPLSNLTATGLGPGDQGGRPTLLINRAGSFSDDTVAAGLGAQVLCASVTAGDYDNDMDVDLYLACRTGASNTPNILYQNLGNGTFVQVANAAGAAGPVGAAVATGAGTADSAITGDYDVDGFLDLFVTNGLNLRPLRFGGPNKLFRNQGGNGNHWVEVDLVGTASDRDAVGARVSATVNSVTQVRVQNGGYHRWSQDSIRSHFGLANPLVADLTVDLKVEWPSGTVENFSNVAADKLYRITEGVGIAPVALGVAPVYPCGPPPLNGAVDAGVFIWRDCPSGEWRMKTAAGGSRTNVTYQGTITSTAAYQSVKPVSLTTGDTLDSTTDPAQIAFSFVNKGSDTDGVNFLPQQTAHTCLTVNSPSGAQVFYGPFRAPLAQPFDLDTQGACVSSSP